MHTEGVLEVAVEREQRDFAGRIKTRSELTGAALCRKVGQVLLRVCSSMLRPLEKGLHLVEREMAAQVGVHTVEDRAKRRPLEDDGIRGAR